jgi:CRISPR-associated exonuclease Cas4
MPFFAALLFLFALWLFWIVHRRQRASGLPGGRVIYTDTRAWGKLEEPLYDPTLGLAGKPDYLVEQRGATIPVEVKSGKVGQEPHDSHIFQLAAYCLLVERTMGKRPPYGILHYPNRTYAIDYTPQLEQALLDLINEIRSYGDRKEAERSHDSPGRCMHCGYRSICDQVLL